MRPAPPNPSAWADAPSPLPFATEGPAVAGEVRARLEDFRVDEIPAYPPCGEGDHLFVRFEKSDLGTPEAVRRLARALEVDPSQSGYAGLKDRRAVTRQWASFLFGDAAKLRDARIAGVRVLETARHRHKIRTGHLRGNRFDILLRGAPADHVPGGDRALAGRRLLLAEDAPDVRSLLVMLLRQGGAEVVVANDGLEAVRAADDAAAEGRPFDAVLMDMQMPLLDGYAATRRLRATGHEMPVIAVTAHAMTGDRERCLAVGCDDHLAKPCTQEQLVHAVRRQLDGRRDDPTD